LVPNHISRWVRDYSSRLARRFGEKENKSGAQINQNSGVATAGAGSVCICFESALAKKGED